MVIVDNCVAVYLHIDVYKFCWLNYLFATNQRYKNKCPSTQYYLLLHSVDAHISCRLLLMKCLYCYFYRLIALRLQSADPAPTIGDGLNGSMAHYCFATINTLCQTDFYIAV